jgi:hypothetical protein
MREEPMVGAIASPPSSLTAAHPFPLIRDAFAKAWCSS